MDVKDLMNTVKKSALFGANAGHGKEFDDVNLYSEKGLGFPDRIIIRRGCIIDCLTFGYEGQVMEHGGRGGSECSFTLQNGEYIIAVSGNYATFNGLKVIQNLCFVTNRNRRFEIQTPCPGSTYFEYKVESGYAVCCLFGREDRYLEDIGFYVRKIDLDKNSILPGGKMNFPEF